MDPQDRGYLIEVFGRVHAVGSGGEEPMQRCRYFVQHPTHTAANGAGKRVVGLPHQAAVQGEEGGEIPIEELVAQHPPTINDKQQEQAPPNGTPAGRPRLLHQEQREAEGDDQADSVELGQHRQ